MISNKEKYDEFIKRFEHISIFSQPWWLDLVCGKENWNLALVERDNRPIASLPYFIKKKWLFRAITQPPLSQTIEPLFDIKSESSEEKEAKLMSELINSLPKVSKFQMNLHSNFTNWLPFYWDGYSQTTFYTYVLDRKNNEDSVWENMSGKRRTEIRKSLNNKITITSDESLDTFYNLYEDTFSRKNRRPPYQKEFLNNLITTCMQRKSGRLLFSKNQEGTPLSCAFFVWDKKNTYYLIGGLNARENTFGAQSLLLWEAIKDSLESSRSFDFEGSMDKGVGQFFSSYGAKQIDYFSLSKKTLKG